jgi:hypothetical protein
MITEANRKKDIHNQYDTHRQALEAETDAQALVDYDIEAGW